MPSRHLGRCDGHHEMVDCIGPLSDPEGSGQRPLWPLVNLLRAIKPSVINRPACAAPPLLICVRFRSYGTESVVAVPRTEDRICPCP